MKTAFLRGDSARAVTQEGGTDAATQGPRVSEAPPSPVRSEDGRGGTPAAGTSNDLLLSPLHSHRGGRDGTRNLGPPLAGPGSGFRDRFHKLFFFLTVIKTYPITTKDTHARVSSPPSPKPGRYRPSHHRASKVGG